MPSGQHRGEPWTEEEDGILLSHDLAADYMEALTSRGYDRTLVAARSRKRVLVTRHRGAAPTVDALAKERLVLERELGTLERRIIDVRQRITEVRIAQLRDALGSDPPPELVESVRRDVSNGSNDHSS